MGQFVPKSPCGGWTDSRRFFEGGVPTATTYIRPYKVAAGKGAVQTMEERFDYGLNPKKLGALSSYLCDPATAPAEFLLVKSQYQAETGRAVERGAPVFSNPAGVPARRSDNGGGQPDWL